MCLSPASFSHWSSSPHPAACLRKITLVLQHKGAKFSLSLSTSSFWFPLPPSHSHVPNHNLLSRYTQSLPELQPSSTVQGDAIELRKVRISKRIVAVIYFIHILGNKFIACTQYAAEFQIIIFLATQHQHNSCSWPEEDEEWGEDTRSSSSKIPVIC